MTTRPAAFTYHDYLCLDDDKRHEVLEGDLVMTPAPSWGHQDASKRLFRILDGFVESQALGVVQFAPVDVVLSEENVLQPDLLFIAKDRKAVIKDKGVFGPPDLVVEVLSLAKPERDTVVKKRIYGKYGVREYWIVDTERKTIEVLILGASGLETDRVYPVATTFHSPLLPGLKFDAREIFG